MTMPIGPADASGAPGRPAILPDPFRSDGDARRQSAAFPPTWRSIRREMPSGDTVSPGAGVIHLRTSRRTGTPARARCAALRALLIAAAMMAPGMAAAQRAEVVDRSALRVCADPAAAPLSARDGTGIENRIADLFAHDLGVPVRYVWFPSGIGFYRNTLNLRRCDIVLGTTTDGEMAQTTIPYYRSSYVLVTRTADAVSAKLLTDPALLRLSIAAQSGSPAIDALAGAGLLGSIRAYTLTGDGGAAPIGARMIDDVANRQVDAAVLWGPIGAYFAARRGSQLTVTPLASGTAASPLAFEIGMAVRFGEARWRARVEQFIRANRAKLQAILTEAHVPLLPLPPEAAS